MALLALVAAAGRKGISRDRLIGILWPDAGEEQARHTLSQTIYTLKRDTGLDWIIPGAELRLDPSISSEIGEFQEALTAGSWETVDALASGVFLDGFYLAGAPEFERWVEEERARLQTAIVRALEQLSLRADEAKDHRGAVRWWTRLTEVDPLSARFAAGKMRALAAAGDRASALAHARGYEDLIRRELDADVDPAIRKLVASLRADPAPAPAYPSERATSAVTPGDGGVGAAAALPAAPRRRSMYYALLLAVVAVAGGSLLLWPEPSRETPFLAVGSIRTEGADSTTPGDVLRDMLATSLGGIEGLQVVANSRLVELMPREQENAPNATTDAARRAGATELIEGEVTTSPTGLRLSLRRVSIPRGVVRRGYVIHAADRYALMDSATATIARDLGRAPPSVTVAQVRTSSPAAYALYDEGLRALYGYDAPAAYRLMSAALARDSTFAMAAFHVWNLARWSSMDDSITSRALELAERLAPRTIERERLLIQATLAEVKSPLTHAVAIAETLAVKYPTDPDGQILLGGVRHKEGDWARSIAAHEQAFVLDSLAGALAGPHCRACQALHSMASGYLWWDSATAAERTIRRLIALRPNELRDWSALIEPLLRQGRRADAEEVRLKALGQKPTGWSPSFLHRDHIRWARYEEVDPRLEADVGSLNFDTRSEAWWLLLLSLRDQGRLREADTLVHQWRVANTSTRVRNPNPPPIDVALLAAEMGRPHLTVRAHRENIEQVMRSATPPAVRARIVTWNLTLAATAYATAGDTATVRRLADSVEAIGRNSNWARDTRLHHMLRGLLLQMEGRHAEAVDAFQRSLFSLTDGYTRTNLLMARSLLELRRPAEAIAVLRPAIRGGVDGSNTYVSRTELREALAQAFEMAGQADSARVHYADVERAWRRADPEFRDRYLRARVKAGL